MSIFYDHLLSLPEVDAILARSIEEEVARQELLASLEAALHHVALDVIFRSIPQNQHEVFLVRFNTDPSSEHHLPYLRQFDPYIEGKLATELHASQQKFIDAIHA